MVSKRTETSKSSQAEGPRRAGDEEDLKRLLRRVGPGRPGEKSPSVNFDLLQEYVHDELARARGLKVRFKLDATQTRDVRAKIIRYRNWSAFHARLLLAEQEKLNDRR